MEIFIWKYRIAKNFPRYRGYLFVVSAKFSTRASRNVISDIRSAGAHLALRVTLSETADN